MAAPRPAGSSVRRGGMCRSVPVHRNPHNGKIGRCARSGPAAPPRSRQVRHGRHDANNRPPWEATVVRPATPADVPAIAGLIRGLAEYEQLPAEPDEGRLRAHLFSPRPYAESLLAEEGGAVVGFALFFHNYSTFRCRPTIYLEDLFVLPAHRGRGHGKALLKALAQLAVSRDCVRLEWSVLNWNTPSIGFYRSLGAEPLDGWTVFRLSGDAL